MIEELHQVLPEHLSGVITKSTHCLLITFGHLAHNCRNMKEAKGKPVPQNRFEVIASRVMQYGVREEAKVSRQETVEEGV